MSSPTAPPPATPELALSLAWNAGWFRPAALRTTDGRPVTVVYRGRWTFGFGPDFRGALIAFGADLREGDVELHLRASAWREHGHHLDPAYNSVILHVVLDERDAAPCRRHDGVEIPTLVIGSALPGPLASLPPVADLAALGSVADRRCIAEVTPATRQLALAAIERAGDARLTAHAAGYEATFTTQTPGQVLYAGLLNALGYSRNRAPMAALAAALPVQAIESRLPAADRATAARIAAALLLGVAGFLPASTGLAAILRLPDSELAALEAHWRDLGAAWQAQILAPGAWVTARVRPPNHPARRLLAAASLLARSGRTGLLTACLEPCTAEEAKAGLTELRALLLGPPRPADPFGRYLGEDRVLEMIVNVVLPFTLAYGAWTGDERLSAGAALLWEAVPAPAANEAVRAFLGQLGGGPALRLRTGRQQQGALHLFRHYCEHRRCYECPIARLRNRAEE